MSFAEVLKSEPAGQWADLEILEALGQAELDRIIETLTEDQAA